MKQFLSIYVIIICVLPVKAQSLHSDFEDGTLQNWTNTDGSLTSLSVEDGENNSKYLQKICDGSNTVLGEMAIENLVDFYGDFNCYDPSGINCIGGVELYVKNENPFDLNIRLGFLGANGGKVVSGIASSFNFPEGSNWYFLDVPLDMSQFAVVEGSGSLEEVLEDVVGFRIIQNEAESFEGIYTQGNLIIDYIGFIFLLGQQENSHDNMLLFPNPVSDKLVLKRANTAPVDLKIYDVSDSLISTHLSTAAEESIDVSMLAKGVYFVRINLVKTSSIKRFIKQ